MRGRGQRQHFHAVLGGSAGGEEAGVPSLILPTSGKQVSLTGGGGSGCWVYSSASGREWRSYYVLEGFFVLRDAPIWAMTEKKKKKSL